MKILIIGLDGATFKIIDPLLEQGRLPTLQQLIKTGSRAMLRSTLPPMSPAAWASFSTGKNPGKHALYDFVKRAPSGYEPTPVTTRDRKGETLWSIMGKAGLKVGIVNVPITYPPERVNGFMVSGFPTPPGANDFTYPRGLAAELRRELPSLSLQRTILLPGDEAAQAVYDDTVEVTKRQTEMLTYLIGQKEWDLLMTVYDASDTVGHHFWKYFDTNHPLYDPHWARIHRDKLYKIYEVLDQNVAKLLKLVDKDTLVIICSDHGFGPIYYCVCFNSWLIKTGLMQVKSSFGSRARFDLYKRGLNNSNLHRVASRLKLLRTEFLYQKKSLISSILNTTTLGLQDVDWNKTLAYSFGNFGPIFINLKGREPQGIVEPEHYNKVLERVEEEAKKFRDPKTGQVIFEEIIRGRDVYSGQYADQGPDLLLYDKKMVYRAQRVFEFGSEKLVTLHPVYSGNHDMEGIFIASGEPILQGKNSGPFDLVDVAPTLLHLLGLPIPSDTDGHVLKEILAPTFVPPTKVESSEKARIIEHVERLRV